MSCLFPLKMYRAGDGSVHSSSKKAGDLVSTKLYKVDSERAATEFFVPCGQCGECRLSRARQWATRCVHEASQWKENCFITLTYKESPPHNSLEPEEARNFIRRFRSHFGKPFKYFLVGEYGDEGNRPHYHALIFGYDFGLSKRHDKDRVSSLDELHNTSALSCSELDDIWGLGFTSVGELSFDSAAYCAQYAMKKVNGAKAAAHYGSRHPEFMRTSQDAIGKQYALRYADEIINNNSVISNGHEQPIPPYYLKQYEKIKIDLSALKQRREEFSSSHSLQKSFVRAQMLDSKFKFKLSKADAFRVRYAKDLYFSSQT